MAFSGAPLERWVLEGHESIGINAFEGHKLTGIKAAKDSLGTIGKSAFKRRIARKMQASRKLSSVEVAAVDGKGGIANRTLRNKRYQNT